MSVFSRNIVLLFRHDKPGSPTKSTHPTPFLMTRPSAASTNFRLFSSRAYESTWFEFENSASRICDVELAGPYIPAIAHGQPIAVIDGNSNRRRPAQH